MDYTIFIRIIDKRIGIPSQEQEQVFERFYRVDNSRKGEGLGIGLSIVKEIVTLHNMSSVPHEETTFEIQLYKSKRKP
nr:sensor histidine kinase [Paenibacillus endoradicis]